jgi:hypothetical protein
LSGLLHRWLTFRPFLIFVCNFLDEILRLNI